MDTFLQTIIKNNGEAGNIINLALFKKMAAWWILFMALFSFYHTAKGLSESPVNRIYPATPTCLPTDGLCETRFSPPSNPEPATSCTHTIRLTDTYGDGWNGGKITVTVNGVAVLTNITLSSGAGPLDYTFTASTGSSINVTRTVNGSYSYEMRIELISGAGTTLLSTQEPTNSPGVTVTGCCELSVPGVASSPGPSNGATDISPCSTDLSWTAPSVSGCNAATSYDIYLGTSATPPYIANSASTSYELPFALNDNTVYYFKVIPKNSAGSASGCPTWSFTTGTSPNPAYCLYGSAINYPSGGTNCAQMTPESNNQSGCIWNRSKISFAIPFDYTVNMYFGNNTGGADGCAFVFQNSPQGISQCGLTGGQLGAGGISNAVVVEFDTYDNDNPAHVFDIAVDHTAIEVDGDLQGPCAPLSGPVQADPLDAYIDDGLIHSLRVTWNPVTMIMAVYVDASLRLSCNYDFVNNTFGGNPNVWWGFTGATGALNNQQYFCPISIPVPVELLEFTAECFRGRPVLTWYTASEMNNQYFTVERSTDGQYYKPVATINGAGYSNSVLKYEFSDEQAPDSTLYYHVTQTDFDGITHEIGNKTLDCRDQSPAFEIVSVLHPNQSNTTINFKAAEAGAYTVQICNFTGQIIDQAIVYCQPGLCQADFCREILPEAYIINIYNGKNKKAVKVVF